MEGEQNTGESVAQPVSQTPRTDLKKFIPSTLAWILAVFAFLVPIFALPNVATSLDASKAWLLLGTVFVGGLLTIIYLLMRGELTLPKTLTLYALAAVVLSTLLSTLLSPQKIVSLMGTGSQIGTLSSIFLFAILSLLGVQAFRDRAPIFRFILALFAGFTVLSIFHILRLFAGADLFSFGVFESPVFSLVGKWNDFAVFSGLILILSIVAEHYFKKNVLVLWASRGFALLSIIFLTMIDFWVLWIVIAVFAAIFTLNSIRTATTSPEGMTKKTFSFSNVSYVAVIVLVIGACMGFLFRFPMGDSTLSQRIVTLLSPQPYAEIVLPPSLSLTIATETWKEGARSALLGVGANRFSNAYFMHKPDGINNTPLWDSSFESGFSHITTFFTTTGVFGLISWLFLLVAVILSAYRLLRSNTEGVKAYLGQSIALGSLYLFAVMSIYLPNFGVVALTFLFLGALMSFRISEDNASAFQIVLPVAKGWGIAMVPLLVLVGISLSVWNFDITRALRSEAVYQNARFLANQGNTKDAATEVSRAEELGPRDAQYRLITDLHLLELQRVLAEAPSSPEALQAKVLELAQNASAASQKAVEFDGTNYLNYVSKASVGDLFATLNIDRVRTAQIARDAYIDATRFNPFSPRLEFAIGRAELLLENRQGALLHLNKARDLRPAYPEAIAALAELNRQDGNLDKAIEIATAGLQSDPSNFIISFQLGFLYYTNQDYDKAIAALENALSINPYYADAKYFLAVSYARRGNKEAALKQFEDIRALNPDNTEIVRVIKNLTEGRDPLADQ